MYMNDRTYELVTFWLVAAHLVISFIMILCNWNTPLISTSTKSKKGSSKKTKGAIGEATNMVEGYVSSMCSLLHNNKLIWIISFLVCAAVCTLLGLCIWGDDDMETTTETNK